MKCPICGTEMKHYRDTLDGWCLCEEDYDCPKGHYSYDYSYGYTRVIVKGRDMLSYSYDQKARKVDEFVCNLLIKILHIWEKIK